jgi:hypothetical protein
MWRLPKISYRPEQKVITIPRPNVNHLRGKKSHKIWIGFIKRKLQTYPNQKSWDYKWNNLDERQFCETGGNEWFTKPKSHPTLNSNQLAWRGQKSSTQ